MDTVKTAAAATPFAIADNTWSATKTKLKGKFTQLTDTDLHFVAGKESELVARLQTKLHKSEAEVQKLISTI
ncbi:MAG: general stress protein CsbD [Flavobacteriales bacterium]|nr:general stress protein CsbD [Flavobacteriales bacterium]